MPICLLHLLPILVRSLNSKLITKGIRTSGHICKHSDCKFFSRVVNYNRRAFTRLARTIRTVNCETSYICFYKWAIPALFFLYFRLFNIVDSKRSIKFFANDWIRTVDLGRWKRPFYQLSHNHCICLIFVKLSIFYKQSDGWFGSSWSPCLPCIQESEFISFI